MYKRIDEMHFKLALKQAVTKWIDEEIYKTDITPDTQIELIDEKRMDQLWEKVKRKSKRSNAIIMKVLKYAAMLLICFSLIGATIVISVPTVRAQVENIIVQIYENYITLNHKQEENKEYPTRIEKEMLPSYLPEGWTIKNVGKNNVTRVYTITTDENKEIMYSQKIYNTNILLDNEEMTKKAVMINNYEGILYEYNDGRKLLLWSGEYVFNLQYENIDMDIIIKIAESIK